MTKQLSTFLRHTNNQLFIQSIFQESVLKSILSQQKFLICFFIMYQAYFVVDEKVAVARSLDHSFVLGW